MRFIDTHAHIQFAAYDEDREAVIERCKEEEIGVIVVGCEYESSEQAVALVQDHNDMWAAVGQHPTDAGLPFDVKKFRTLAQSKKVIAIGECGLDYYRLPKEGDREAMRAVQRKMFEQQIDLAHELHLPLVIHCRDAHDDIIEILLKRFTSTSSHPHSVPEHGVLHCFTGNVLEAQSYLDLNFLISFTGIITFADQYDDVVRLVPLEKILIETDSPFLTPETHRGKRNSPVNVKCVAERIAKIKDVPLEQVLEQTMKNAVRLFKLK